MQYEVDRAAAAAAEQRERNLNALREWLTAKHPEIKSSIAVDRLFESYMDFDVEPLTGEAFEFALGNLQSMLGQRQHVPTQDEIKAQLIDAICSMVRLDSFQLANERKRLEYQSLAELTARLDALTRKRELEGKSFSELSQIAKGPKIVNKYPGYPQLTSTFTPKGEVRSIPTREYLRQLAKTDLHTFKKMVAVYGSQQINDFLNQENSNG